MWPVVVFYAYYLCHFGGPLVNYSIQELIYVYVSITLLFKADMCVVIVVLTDGG